MLSKKIESNERITLIENDEIIITYNDKKSIFKDLLGKDGSVSIHHRNVRTLAVELLKVFKGSSPVVFAEAFPVKQQSQHNMRNYSYFAMPRAKMVNHGLESLLYINSKLWDSTPPHMEEIILSYIRDYNKETLLMNLNMVLKLGKLICAYADFTKFIYYIIHFLSLFSCYLLEFMEFI